jgi:hypothetical protein
MRLLAFTVTLVIAACSGGPAGPVAPAVPAAAPTIAPGHVSATDGRLLVTINFGDGIEYALNGQARDFGFPELDTTVMPDWPDASSLGPIIDRGLELCF